jgi:hypothetical protein
MDCEDGFFPITSVHRLDIQEVLHLRDEQVAKITDDMMREIARKMADDYCEQLFWDHLPIIAEYVAEREGLDLFKQQPLSGAQPNLVQRAPIAPCHTNTELGGDRKCN